METSYTLAEKRVGLFVIGIALLLLTTVVILGRGKDWFAEEVTFYTSFKESYNLQANAAVKLFKADIGKVKRISLGDNNVNVQLAVLAKYASRIRQDSVAVVDSPTLIGSEYVSIVPGAADSPRIPVGGMIPSIERKSISDVLKEFEVEKTALLTVRTIHDLAGLVTVMKDPQGPLLTTLTRIEQTVAHLEQITGGIRHGQGSLGALVASSELIDGVLLSMDKVNALLDDIRVTAARGPGLMDQVSDNLSTIQTAGAGVVENVQVLQPILEEARLSLGSIRVILENLKQGSEDVPQVTATAREGIREIREGVENIDRVVQSLRRNVFIRSNLPDETLTLDTDAGIRSD
jgi:phospholipid/cholesterol/gamma-HCH transport system substrate-binding protein